MTFYGKKFPYRNGVLIGNWVEEQNNKFEFQNDGNKDTVYQVDYQKLKKPILDNRLTMMQMKEKSWVIDIGQ